MSANVISAMADAGRFYLPSAVWAERQEALALRLCPHNLRRGLFILKLDAASADRRWNVR